MKRKLLLGALLASSLFAATDSHAQSFTNAGLETWHNFTSATLALEAPNNWYGTDSLIAAIAPVAGSFGYSITAAKQLYKSTDSHSGQFAAEVQSKFVGNTVGNIPGVFSNAKIAIDFIGLVTGGNLSDPAAILQYLSYSQATPITNMVDTVSAWVKLESANLDTAMITVMAVKKVQASGGGDSTAVLGAGEYRILPGTNAYTRVAVPVLYQGSNVPEELIVVFTSSDPMADTVHSGNKLLVDDVAFSYKSNGTSIQQPLLAEQVALVYPNPARGTVYFNLNPRERAEEYMLTITDVSGRVVLHEQLKEAVNAKNVKSWAKGAYFYNLGNTRNGRFAKGKFVVE
ncbi:T9SS type A sorting domain-containing protein [Taibaiella chishuiensis]|uniref:Putative secreted protein (Por secretion system target) n=1 Tax=Taibaiella chishuiensis TaxID=1434707 RepID=A0A2P8D746_9BACT|nr:T9SS type A sorting domain-containing protein [Taibaiella chishuiensis]PSK93043.1 putative secreted protein (Por secretion system target) [Taibaiella chishuiensis]